MKTIGIGIGCIVSLVLLIFVILLLKIDVSDMMFSILSGSIISSLSGMLALSKNVSSSKVMLIVLLSMMTSAVAWLISFLLLRITTISLYSSTAVAFDLIVGIIGSTSVTIFMIERYSSDMAKEM